MSTTSPSRPTSRPVTPTSSEILKSPPAGSLGLEVRPRKKARLLSVNESTVDSQRPKRGRPKKVPSSPILSPTDAPAPPKKKRDLLSSDKVCPSKKRTKSNIK